MSEYAVTWDPVHAFVGRVLGGRTTTIVAGTPEWCALDDNDPAKITALLIAGSRWCLEEEIAQLHASRDAEKAAAVEVVEAADWTAVARRIRNRDIALRTGAHIPRRTA
ncbi:DUF2742 domain-containing protein [Gordonia alkanivorans]|uniref:DUF2742 domain-containing protein n=1 Tax=Gordonia alkanivorans NBRC 16433 TaxID=1027371 RepID=F9VVE9_9ACTN|nr:DUF2742 domain-containing protein [Gordonia alkanivorans]GAA12578.1 hypothetical protein GOALK_056_00110 [Gordonia alkanivorans NBRC 16433]